jgi:hypothetical protein
LRTFSPSGADCWMCRMTTRISWCTATPAFPVHEQRRWRWSCTGSARRAGRSHLRGGAAYPPAGLAKSADS